MRTSIRREGIMKRIIVVGLGAIVITVMSGCTGESINANNKNPSNDTSMNANSGNTTTNEVLKTDFANEALVALQPIAGGTVAGEAAITYNEETKVMSVEVSAAGLEPESEHVQHIHAGTCEEPGEAVYPLDNLKANGDGEASTTNTFQDIEAFDVANMVLNIHKGADLEGDNAQQIACGTVLASEA